MASGTIVSERKTLLFTSEGHPALTCFLPVPPHKNGTTFGLIALANKEASYDETDRTTVETPSVAIAEALTRVRLDRIESRASSSGNDIPSARRLRHAPRRNAAWSRRIDDLDA